MPFKMSDEFRKKLTVFAIFGGSIGIAVIFALVAGGGDPITKAAQDVVGSRAKKAASALACTPPDKKTERKLADMTRDYRAMDMKLAQRKQQLRNEYSSIVAAQKRAERGLPSADLTARIENYKNGFQWVTDVGDPEELARHEELSALAAKRNADVQAYQECKAKYKTGRY